MKEVGMIITKDQRSIIIHMKDNSAVPKTITSLKPDDNLTWFALCFTTCNIIKK